MWTRRLNATQALQVVRSGRRIVIFLHTSDLPATARDQIWPNPGFQEQLVLFELCQYAPSPSNGIYANWRAQLDRKLKASGLR